MNFGDRAHETSADPSFDRYARLVRGLLGAPTALASLVDDDRQLILDLPQG